VFKWLNAGACSPPGPDIAVYTMKAREVDLMQDVNPGAAPPTRPTLESLGVAIMTRLKLSA